MFGNISDLYDQETASALAFALAIDDFEYFDFVDLLLDSPEVPEPVNPDTSMVQNFLFGEMIAPIPPVAPQEKQQPTGRLKARLLRRHSQA